MLMRFFLFSFAFLAACSPFQNTEPMPVMQTIKIAISPALQPLSQALQACAAEQPEVILDVIETPAGSLMEVNADLYFRLGEPSQLPAFAALLGWEQIVVITHPSADSSALSKPQLQSIFSGMSAAVTGPYAQVWVPLDGDETRQAFEAVVLQNGLVSPLAKLAPNPAAMLTAVAADRDAIGYLPIAWVTKDVNTFDVGISLPVLVLADDEPQGPSFLLVSCLQGETGQSQILERYTGWDVNLTDE